MSGFHGHAHIALPPSFSEYVLDPLDYSKSSMEEKREIVHKLLKSSQNATAFLKSWTRRELIQILCAEMGKERKYTGLAKIKIIEHLLKVITGKVSSKHAKPAEQNLWSLSNNDNQTSAKRQRKMDTPSPLPEVAEKGSNGSEGVPNGESYCKNSACKATLLPGDAFCRRCSCCICYKYDDNKDPSIWLVCNSDPPNEGESCGSTCHLECAFRDKRARIMVGGSCPKLDGSFSCVSCKKVNDLLGCCKKQLSIAKNVRRLDPLCYRIFLCRKLLKGTEKYTEVRDIVETAAKKLEKEVGALEGLPSEMARGIVGRLSSGSEVQRLCSSALQMLDSLMVSDQQPMTDVPEKGGKYFSPFCIDFEDVSATSVTVVLKSAGTATLGEAVSYTLWHREAKVEGYPAAPTGTFFGSENQISIAGLGPGTTYMLKVVAFRNGQELEKYEGEFSTLGSSRKRYSVLSLNGVESKTTGEQWQKNPPQRSVSVPETPNSGRSLDSDRVDEMHLMQVCKTTDLERVVGNSVSTVIKDGMNYCVVSAPGLVVQTESHKGSTNSLEEDQAVDVPAPENKNRLGSIVLHEISNDNESNANEGERFQRNQSDSVLPSTPCKEEIRKDGTRNTENWSMETEKEPQSGSCSRKRNAVRCQADNCAQDGPVDKEYEHCVKVIRWLECQGHMQKSFREKLLTWFSLRATAQEKRIVNVFVETLIDDPPSLVEQLMDTFSGGICSKKSVATPTRLCMKPWH